MRAYWRHPYRRAGADRPATCWQEGPARLLDYGGGGMPVLVVPSLINRAYILDLMPERSFLAHLAGAGLRPLLLDWGAPAGAELSRTLADQSSARAQRALDAVLALTGQPPVLLGYCMGGLLACALAQARQHDLAGLALLATPWDFHAGGTAGAPLLAADLLPLTPSIATLGYAPVDLLQTFFALLDPLRRDRKFQRFADLPTDEPTGAPVRRGRGLAATTACRWPGRWRRNACGTGTSRTGPARGLWAPGGDAGAAGGARAAGVRRDPAARPDRAAPASAEALARPLPRGDRGAAGGGACQHGGRRACARAALAAARGMAAANRA